MSKNASGCRSDVIRCDNCGEDYSITYKRCPFCNEKPGRIAKTRDEAGADYEPNQGEPNGDALEEIHYESGRRGGKHLDESGGGHPGVGRTILRGVGLLVTLVIVGAAIWIVVTQIVPKFQKELEVVATPPVVTATLAPTLPEDPLVVVTPDTGEPTTPEISGDPTAPPVIPSANPEVTPSPTPTSATTGLTLSSKDFTLDNTYKTNQMSAKGASGTVTWSVKNSAIATVTDKGYVTAVSSGSTTLTATDASGQTAECIVRVANFTAGGAAEATPAVTAKPAGSARLSSSDFTLNKDYGLSTNLSVIGGTAAAWSSSNTSIATVSSDGKVTGVGSGECTITVTLKDGGTLKAVARIRI